MWRSGACKRSCVPTETRPVLLLLLPCLPAFRRAAAGIACLHPEVDEAGGLAGQRERRLDRAAVVVTAHDDMLHVEGSHAVLQAAHHLQWAGGVVSV